MSSFGTIRLGAVFRMLKRCAPGHTVTATDHYYCIQWNRRTYPSFPKGAHGRSDPEIQIGRIRHLIRQLEIDPDCAHRALPALGKPPRRTRKERNDRDEPAG